MYFERSSVESKDPGVLNVAGFMSGQAVSEVKDLLASFGDILAEVPGQTNLIEHGIVTTLLTLLRPGIILFLSTLRKLSMKRLIRC